MPFGDTRDAWRKRRREERGLPRFRQRFEDEFEITIPDEDAEKIRTVGNAIEYISSKS
jgi:hypothetical protein